MATIDELNERRARTYDHLTMLGMMNTSHDRDERIKQVAQYRLAKDAWMAAEREFNGAIGALSAAELEALATRPVK
jgi:hypothetical protein